MEYTLLNTEIVGRVGVITLADPPRNAFSKRMIREMLNVFDEFEQNDTVRCVMLKSTGEHFSQGAGGDDLKKFVAGEAEESNDPESYSVLGGRLVERIDLFPKPTLVAARGICLGGSTAIFNAFDIRIVAENFQMHDGDIYYGTVGSWGMSSLRLPMWIGRNKVLDYMFLNENFTGRQCYELGLASKVVPNELVDKIGLEIATKMATAAPIAVRYYKECVRKASAPNMADARAFEVESANKVFETEDCRNGLAYLIQGKQAEFFGK